MALLVAEDREAGIDTMGSSDNGDNPKSYLSPAALVSAVADSGEMAMVAVEGIPSMPHMTCSISRGSLVPAFC